MNRQGQEANIPAFAMAMFVIGTLAGDFFLVWSFLNEPGPGLFLLIGQFFISLWAGWKWSNGGVVARVSALVAALTGLLIILVVYASFYQQLGLVSSDHKLTKDPAICLYFSIVTFTTIGYGDFVPSPAARMLAGSEALVGYATMAVVIATLARVLSIFMGDEVAKPAAASGSSASSATAAPE